MNNLLLRERLNNQVYVQARCLESNICIQVHNQVNFETSYELKKQLRDKIFNDLANQLRDKVGKQLRDMIWKQVSVSIHNDFRLKITYQIVAQTCLYQSISKGDC